jgi:outer membrane protein assembly factor BamB
VYFVSNEMRAFATDDGTVEWGTSFLGASAGSSPVFDNDAVYMSGGNGAIHRIPVDSSMLVTAPVWEFKTWDTVTADLAIADGRVFVASVGGEFYALGAESGACIDSVSLSCECRAAPVVAGDDVYLAGHGSGVYAFELSDSK